MTLTAENKAHLRQSVISDKPEKDVDHRFGGRATAASRKHQVSANVRHALRGWAGSQGLRWEEMGLWSPQEVESVKAHEAELRAELVVIEGEIDVVQAEVDALPEPKD
ncbi:hypothetical protein CMI37_08920 [Candidatus Pacearchaeota archaeon]|nr:hypothetical protein [Candidatus Pacearchaeota archaeon]|tara:strand:+ start:562 stop:885 length:324 start_codon:yes stop_codon:yes gene_type:complete